MIERLSAGMKVRLPSGNRVMLIAADDGEWTCVYLDGSKSRGEVHLSSAMLQRGEVI